MADADYTYEAPETGTSFQVLLTTSSTSSYSFASAGSPADSTLVTTTQYDAFGNVALVSAERHGSGRGLGRRRDLSIRSGRDRVSSGLSGSRIEYADQAKTMMLRQDRYSYDQRPASSIRMAGGTMSRAPGWTWRMRTTDLAI